MSPPRMVLTQHAIERARERVFPGLSFAEVEAEMIRRLPVAHRVIRRRVGPGRTLWYLAGDPPACVVCRWHGRTLVAVTAGGWDETMGRGLRDDVEPEVPDLPSPTAVPVARSGVVSATAYQAEIGRLRRELDATRTALSGSNKALSKRGQYPKHLRELLAEIVAGGHLAGAPQRLRDRAAHYAKHDPEVPAPGEG